jgi:type IV pilus assembly protein PilM
LRLELNLDALSARTPPMLGLDISSTAVKLVELADAGRGMLRIERYAIEALPREAMSDGNIANLDLVADALRRALKELGSRVRNVAMALPSSAVITKKIVVPATLTGIELENQVESEANQVIPFSLDEVNLDFQVLGALPNSPTDNQVLLAAARKEKVEDRVALAEAAGLKALVLDVEAYAGQSAFEQMAHLLPASAETLTVALIDIGAQAMHINILARGESVYLREHNFGASQLNHEIARRYGMTSEEAEQAKRRGRLPESYDLEVRQPYSETLAMEIGRALQLFTTSTQYNKVDQIILAGGGAILSGIEEIVSARTGAPTLIANPFSKMALGSRVKPQALAVDAPSLFVACGLALRRFDPQ